MNNLLTAQVLLQQEQRQVVIREIDKRQRTMGVRDRMARRDELGQYGRFMPELHADDIRTFRNFIHMDPQMFQELVAKRFEGPRNREGREVVSGRNASRPGLSRTASVKNQAYSQTFPDQRWELYFFCREGPGA